jgi:hydroxymethylpyrimidine pyrophosphatase-like HAD family hydrolase
VTTVRIEAVVADLDGTLVRPDFSVSAGTLAALDTIRAAGMPVVVATARTPHGVRHVQAVAGRADIAVCCSGAIGWSVRRRVSLWQERIPPRAARRVIELAVACGAGVAGFDGELWRMTAEYDRLSPGQPSGPERITVEPTVLAAASCATMAIRHPSWDFAGMAEALASEAHAALSRVGNSTVVDLTPIGVDKGTGVRRALADLGVDPAAAISFGDMPNDIPMFAATGRSYAVGDHPTLVNAVNEVLDPVERDGFSHKISALALAGWRTP